MFFTKKQVPTMVDDCIRNLNEEQKQKLLTRYSECQALAKDIFYYAADDLIEAHEGNSSYKEEFPKLAKRCWDAAEAFYAEGDERKPKEV